MQDNCFYYRAHVVSVYDGDTCRADIDLGFGIWIKKEILRLNRINAPEVRGDERVAGLQSRDALRGMVLDRQVVVQTIQDSKGKYGRYLAEIWIEDEDGKWFNVNDRLVEEGQAIYQAY
jgi:micrococcal nuclease